MVMFQKVSDQLKESPKTWLITGVAGFIGSHLLETLLKLNQRVVGLDNFFTGYPENLIQVREAVGPNAWANFTFYKGDIRDLKTCEVVCSDVDYILHQAALCSVHRSIEDPMESYQHNVMGFLNMITTARDMKIKSFVYASTCAVYGDLEALPAFESNPCHPISPYALTKFSNELNAENYYRCYGFNSIGLRYFNVYGPRQTLTGGYVSVIPKWISAVLNDEQIYINGDGSSTRDYCYIEDIVQANILAATTENPEALNQIYNVGANARISLDQVFRKMTSQAQKFGMKYTHQPEYRPFPIGDVLHTQSSTDKAHFLLGYVPQTDFDAGLMKTLEWYKEHH